jgi:YD repeat-containing protein
VDFTYGPMGVLTGRKQNTHSVRFAYDSELQLRSITNEDNEKYLFNLDGEGQVIKEIGFDGLTREYIRDGAGRVKRVVRPNDKWTDYDYDGTGNVIRETQYDGKVTLYNYDYDGMLKQAQNSRNDGEACDMNALTFKI